MARKKKEETAETVAVSHVEETQDVATPVETVQEPVQGEVLEPFMQTENPEDGGLENEEASSVVSNAATGGAMTTEDIQKAMARYKAMHTPYVREERKIGRNEPCPCGSGKKYKYCCGKKF